MKTATKIKLAKALIFISTILMIFNFENIEYSTANWKAYFGPVSNILLIFVMVISIRDMKKSKNE